jgi:hypothetical protein
MFRSIEMRRASLPIELLRLLAVPVLAVSALLWLSQPAKPFMAQVVDPSVTRTDDGFVGNVTWIDDEGVRRVSSVELTSEHVDSGTVPVVTVEGEVSVVDPSEQTQVPITVLLVTAAIALAFAVVVLATLRGFGFVRGTGRAGEMTPDEVQESRAFYWRQ